MEKIYNCVRMEIITLRDPSRKEIMENIRKFIEEEKLYTTTDAGGC